METLYSGGMLFAFSIIGTPEKPLEPRRLETFNALSQGLAWRKIVGIVDKMCREGILGLDVDSNRVKIELVNTGTPIKES